jgi:hypothetical protein
MRGTPSVVGRYDHPAQARRVRLLAGAHHLDWCRSRLIISRVVNAWPGAPLSIAKTGAALSLWQEARRAGPKTDLQVADDGPPSPRLANDDRKPTVEAPESSGAMDDSSELRLLFHRLNNELGIILAHAELLEAEASDDIDRARAAQAVASVIDAMETTREIRRSTTGQ